MNNARFQFDSTCRAATVNPWNWRRGEVTGHLAMPTEHAEAIRKLADDENRRASERFRAKMIDAIDESCRAIGGAVAASLKLLEAKLRAEFVNKGASQCGS